MRDNGFYWVRDSLGWRIAEWADHYCYGLCWAVCLNELTYTDEDFEEIDEARIGRNI